MLGSTRKRFTTLLPLDLSVGQVNWLSHLSSLQRTTNRKLLVSRAAALDHRDAMDTADW